MRYLLSTISRVQRSEEASTRPQHGETIQMHDVPSESAVGDKRHQVCRMRKHRSRPEVPGLGNGTNHPSLRRQQKGIRLHLLRPRVRQQLEPEATHNDSHGRKTVHMQYLPAVVSRDEHLEEAFVHPSKSHGGIGRRDANVACPVAATQVLRVPEIVHRCESIQAARAVAQRRAARFARDHNETGDGAATEIENLSPQVPQMQRNLLRIVQINVAHMQRSQSEWCDDDDDGHEDSAGENDIDEHSAQGRDIIAQTGIVAAAIDTN